MVDIRKISKQIEDEQEEAMRQDYKAKLPRQREQLYAVAEFVREQFYPDDKPGEYDTGKYLGTLEGRPLSLTRYLTIELRDYPGIDEKLFELLDFILGMKPKPYFIPTIYLIDEIYDRYKWVPSGRIRVD